MGGSAPQAFERPGTAITPAVLALLSRDLDRELGRALYLPSTQQLVGSARTKNKAPPYKKIVLYKAHLIVSPYPVSTNKESGDIYPCKAPDCISRDASHPDST